MQQPLQLLDSRMISRYFVRAGGESHPRGVGFIFPTAPDEEEAEDTLKDDEMTREEENVGSSRSGKYIFSTQFRSLQQHIDERDKVADRKMKRLAARQDHMFNAMNRSFATLNKALQNLNPVAIDQFQFQTPDPIPQYPLSDSDVEECKFYVPRQPSPPSPPA